MRKQIKLTLMTLVVGLLAGCTPTSSEAPALTAAEFDIAVNEIALKVPLAIERNTGTTIQTNNYRNSLDPVAPVPELKDGNNLTLTTGGTLTYENEDTGVFLYPDYEIEWSYMGAGDEDTEYGTFEFETDAEGKYIAVPQHPTYKPDYDENNKPLHTVPPTKVARLYPTIKIGEHSKRLSMDMFLLPIEQVDLLSLLAVRDAKANSIAKVRGYVTGIFPDWNTAGIVDGDTGLGLYKLDASGFQNAFKVGDLVEAVGSVGNFNGLAQLSYIKSVKVLDPVSFPEIKAPEVNEFTHDDLYQTLLLGNTDPGSPIFDKDNALVKFDNPFTFKKVTNRGGDDIGLAGFVPDGKTHYNVILEGTTSTNIKFEVSMSMNYHMGLDNHTAFKNFLVANQNKAFYYEGPLTVYNSLQFGPYHFEGSLILA